LNLKTKLKIRHNYNQYHVPCCPRTHKLKKNAIFISTTNSVKHEMAKALACYMIKKWGEVKFSLEAIALLNLLDIRMAEDFEGWKENPSDFITEAVKCSDSSRRVDVVNLNTGDEIEIETKKSVKKDGAVSIYI